MEGEGFKIRIFVVRRMIVGMFWWRLGTKEIFLPSCEGKSLNFKFQCGIWFMQPQNFNNALCIVTSECQTVVATKYRS